MFPSFLPLTQKHSLFLFGPRDFGKSTLLKVKFKKENAYWIDLLDLAVKEKFSREPNLS